MKMEGEEKEKKSEPFVYLYSGKVTFLGPKSAWKFYSLVERRPEWEFEV